MCVAHMKHILTADPNFKIAVSSMQILGDLVSKVGRDIEPQLKCVRLDLCLQLPCSMQASGD